MANSFNSTDFLGQHVTIMGLGRFGGGVAAARFLTQRGASVTVTDLRTESDLSDSLAKLSDVPIARFALGEHPEDVLTDCQVLVANPAVRPGNELVALARSRQIEVTTEIELFLRHNPALVIAVTGSNGKSTTTAMIHHFLVRANPDFGGKVWMGGNIGISLLDRVGEIQSTDIVVLELSSFQLHLLREKKFRPDIAVLTNFSPNHLDWHGSVAEYRRAKQAIFDAQVSTDAAIVPGAANCQDEDSGSLPWRIRGRRFAFALQDSGTDGAVLEDGMLVLLNQGFEDAIRFSVPSHSLRRNNQMNIAAAACAAWIAGADPTQFSCALQEFQPLPHRLQLVAECAGRQFWNDSIATTPESAIMALRVFPGRIILLAGGYDKGQDLREFAAEIGARAAAVVLMGQTATSLQQLIHRESAQLPVSIAVDFADAFRSAVAFSRQGDIVLLSPGCASYGWFQDFRERGDLFSAMARDWSPDS
ncbi:MAG TPA: UDP-N-acetylmuramoyl-L-alanine--D-glutamate ligase [Planctomycetaceae bacterium]|nr:UDP-N-acetylmuramoyl-L-alanine--D-glutamate ligase [Planctomycetaceae bacterium]